VSSYFLRRGGLAGKEEKAIAFFTHLQSETQSLENKRGKFPLLSTGGEKKNLAHKKVAGRFRVPLY